MEAKCTKSSNPWIVQAAREFDNFRRRYCLRHYLDMEKKLGIDRRTLSKLNIMNPDGTLGFEKFCEIWRSCYHYAISQVKEDQVAVEYRKFADGMMRVLLSFPPSQSTASILVEEIEKSQEKYGRLTLESGAD